VLKDRLYTFAPRNPGRRSAQTAMYRIASALVRLIAPILVYTSEEIWKLYPHAPGEAGTIHAAHFPKASEFAGAGSAEAAKNWETLLTVRQEVLKSLEQSRAAKEISAALEAKVTLTANGKLAALLTKYAPQLPALFIVSQVHVETRAAAATPGDGAASGSPLEGLSIQVAHADGKKCERCWNYSTHVGESADYPTICERCVAALDEIERTGAGVVGAAPAGGS